MDGRSILSTTVAIFLAALFVGLWNEFIPLTIGF